MVHSDPDRWSDIALQVQFSGSGPTAAKMLRIQELPPELITKTIRFFLEDLPRITQLPLEAGVHHPRLRITQVCAAWRAIAFSIHDWWDLEVSVDGNYHTTCNLASAWLRQTACRRLNLTILFDLIVDKFRADYKERISLFLEILVIPHRHRLQKLSVPVTNSGMRKLLRLPDNSLSHLDTLHLRLVDDQEESATASIMSSPFMTAPLLQTLHLTLRHGLPLKQHFPWSQLTTITLYGPNLDAATCLTVMSNCVSVANLAFSVISPINTEMESRISDLQNLPLHLPSVKKLNICFNCSNPTPFLLSLQLSSLIHLAFGSLALITPWTSAYKRFFQSFAQTLECFETKNNHMYVEIGDEILEWMPNLRALIFGRNYRLTPSTLRRIGTGELLPMLEHLECCARDFSLVVQMLSARQGNSQTLGSPLTPIKRVKIYARTWQIDDEFWKLRAQGVEIQLERI